MSKLTATQIRNAKQRAQPYKLSDGHGLYFHVSRTGKKTWRYRYKLSGKESIYTLGEYPKMSLANARAARMEARELVKSGINPAKQRRAEKQAALDKQAVQRDAQKNTFEFVAMEWIEQQRGRWSKGHADAVANSLKTHVYPTLGNHQIGTITPPMVLEVVRKIEARDALEISRKVLQRINAVCRYSVQTGKATFNPAADMRGALKTRKVKHRTAISLEELPQFMKDLGRGKVHTTTELALRFLILTATRTSEVRFATWDEINTGEKLWRIPAERMKMDGPHTIPLSSQAMAVLDRVAQLFGRQGLVFPGIRDHSKALSQNTMIYALYRLGYHSRATVHGFRATFSTIANESGFDGDVIEKALAHEERNRVRAAYHGSEYLEQRRELMQWWGNLLQHMEHGAKVIPMGRMAKG